MSDSERPAKRAKLSAEPEAIKSHTPAPDLPDVSEDEDDEPMVQEDGGKATDQYLDTVRLRPSFSLSLSRDL